MAKERGTELELRQRRNGNRKQTAALMVPGSTSALSALASAITAQAPIFIGICDANFKLVFLNAAGRALVGLTFDADISRYQIADFFIDEYRTIINDVALPALAREGRWEGELRLRNFIDPTRQMDVSWLAFALYDEDGRFVGSATINSDISARKQAEKDLQESRAQLASILAQLPVGVGVYDVSVYDKDGKLLQANDSERAMDWLERACRGETAVLKYRIVRSDGTVCLIRDTAFPIRDEQGDVRRLGGAAQHVTSHSGSTVYLVDPDETSRGNLTLLLQGVGYTVKAFSSATSFLEIAPVLAAGCVLVDIRSAQSKGLLIPKEVKARRNGLPVVVIGDAQGDVRFGSAVIKAGAIDFLPIPYSGGQLLDVVASTLAGIRTEADGVRATLITRAHVIDMTPREREVLDGLLAGKTNKEIARDIDISPRTVEVHRAHVMQRIGAKTLTELVLMATAAGLGPLSSFHDEPSVR